MSGEGAVRGQLGCGPRKEPPAAGAVAQSTRATNSMAPAVHSDIEIAHRGAARLLAWQTDWKQTSCAGWALKRGGPRQLLQDHGASLLHTPAPLLTFQFPSH